MTGYSSSGASGTRQLLGADVQFSVRGEGSPIVLLHGFAASSFSWRGVAPRLAASGFKVVTLDFPGFGQSARGGALDYRHETQAGRVEALLEEIGLDSVLVAGHSMGGAIAQRLAASSPRVSRLVLVAPADASEPSRSADSGPLSFALARAGFEALARVPRVARGLVSASLKRMVYDKEMVSEAMVRGYTGPLLRPGTAASLIKMGKDTAQEPLLDLSTIQVPVLVISGERDRVIPRETTEGVASAIAGARHIVARRTGHMVPDERPQELVDEIVRFAAG